MRKKGSPERQAINKHLHAKHCGFAGHGSTENRFIQHDLLHSRNDCDHTHPVPGDPSIYEDTTREG